MLHPILIEAARHHPQAAVREEAVEALAEKAAERVVRTLEDVVYQDQSATVREEALEALGELAGGEGLAVLVKVASTHPDRYMREASAIGAGSVSSGGSARGVTKAPAARSHSRGLRVCLGGDGSLERDPSEAPTDAIGGPRYEAATSSKPELIDTGPPPF